MRRRVHPEGLIFQKVGAARGKLALARVMRRMPTDAEARLWTALRSRRLGGWKFRRQHIIKGYIVDFYCAELWLAVEVDGPVHQGRHLEDRDRDDNLASLGVRIVRLRNDDVLQRIEATVTFLARRCEDIAVEIAEQRGLRPSPAPRGRVRARNGSGGGGGC